MAAIWRRKGFRLLLFVAIGSSIRLSSYAQQPQSRSAPQAPGSPQIPTQSSYAVFLEDVELTTKPLSELIAAVAVVFAASQYRQAVRTRHAEWLLSLFKSFYETPKYQKIRSLVDSPNSTEFLQFESDLKQLRDTPDLQRLDRYLNFFEFVAVLWRSGQVTQSEVCDLFEYYLKNLKSSPTITHYIDHQGFQQLHQLLTTIKAG